MVFDLQCLVADRLAGLLSHVGPRGREEFGDYASTHPLDCYRKAPFPLPIAVQGTCDASLVCHRAEYPVAVFCLIALTDRQLKIVMTAGIAPEKRAT